MSWLRLKAQLTDFAATLEQFQSENEKLEAKLETTSMSLHEADIEASHLRAEVRALKIELRQVKNKLYDNEKDEHKAMTSPSKRRRFTAYNANDANDANDARQISVAPYHVASRQDSRFTAAPGDDDVAATPQLSARDLAPLVAQIHHQRQPQVNEASQSLIHIGSSSPQIMSEEDRDISTQLQVRLQLRYQGAVDQGALTTFRVMMTTLISSSS